MTNGFKNANKPKQAGSCCRLFLITRMSNGKMQCHRATKHRIIVSE